MKDMNNYNSDIYRMLSLLYMKGARISDILKFMGISTVYIYGAGEIGELVLSDLSGNVKIAAVFDRDQKKQGMKKVWTQPGRDCTKKKVWYEYQVFSAEEIPRNEIPLLITPSGRYFAIAEDLMERGNSRRRLLSLNLILHYGVYFLSEIYSGHSIKYQSGVTKEFLITGAQFRNRGAQNMSYIAISEIRRRYEDAVIWYLPNYGEEYRQKWDKYRIIFLLDGTGRDSTLCELMPKLDGVIDISGTAWAVKNAAGKKLNCFRMAYEHRIPIYFMPQSFDSPAFDSETMEEQRKILSYANIIYAREKKGYYFLKDSLGLENVRKSEDIVLQNTHLYKEFIFSEKENEINYQLLTKDNVAVIPNKQNNRYGNPEMLAGLYREIIKRLVLFGKKVYIISYAEDWEICKAIYDDFLDNESVYFYDKAFDCIGYREIIKNFDYAIASRFHAIVNAYRESIPCLIIGWLEKYEELSEKFEQSLYLFDVRYEINTEKLFHAMEKLEETWRQESKKIAKILPTLQKENCFDVLK